MFIIWLTAHSIDSAYFCSGNNVWLSRQGISQNSGGERGRGWGGEGNKVRTRHVKIAGSSNWVPCHKKSVSKTCFEVLAGCRTFWITVCSF